MKRIAALLGLTLFSFTGKGQVVSSFLADSPVCREENIALTNESQNATVYEWDFCVGELDQTPTALTAINDSSFDGPFDLTLSDTPDGWISLVPSRFGNNILRLNFGSDIEESSPALQDLGNVGGLFDGPNGISVIEVGNNWHAFAVNRDNALLIRMDFGTSMLNTPTATSLGDLGEIEFPDGIIVLHDGVGFKGLIVNQTKVIVLDFGSDITSNPGISTFTIAGSNRLWDISVALDEGNWYGLVSSFGNGKLYHLNFGAVIDNSPAIVEIDNGGMSLGSPADNVVVQDGGNYYGFVQLRIGDLLRLDFGSSLVNTSPTLANLGDFNQLTNDSGGLVVVKDSSEWTGLVANFDTEIIDRLTFPNQCNATPSFSREFEPQVHYSQQNDYTIYLNAADNAGESDFSTRVITVSSEIAPDISFSSDNCVSVPTQFTSINSSANIDTYTWDFGDGTIIGPAPGLDNPTHDYAATLGAGSYDVVLTVESTEGCTNFTQQSVEIFDEPVPDFINPPGTPCAGEEISFTNNTANIPGTPGVITYDWDFNGEGSSTDENPTFTFATGGLKEITLTTTIPGCTDFVMKSLNILEGPITDFSFQNICLGDAAQFTDLTTGSGIDPDSYMWDFGDGGSSTEMSTSHVYNTPGDYNVSLSVANTNCTVVDTQTITVHALPNTNFINEQACVGPVQFTDVTTVDNANITEWAWDFDNGDTSEDQNPLAQFNDNLDFNVSLTTTSNFGCSAGNSRIVSVLAAPVPEFDFALGCLGESTQFTDETSIAEINPVTSYFWEIEDEVYTVMNPVHTFSEAGTFTASMTITTANTCTVTAEREIVIPALPVASYTYTTACANSAITFEDQTMDAGDPIVSWTWDFDGLGTSNGALAQFTFAEAGNYNVSLTITSALGCTSFISQTIEVNPQPTASFIASSTFGAPPLSVDFTDQSTEATSLAWLLNDTTDPFSNDSEPSLNFDEEGDFSVALVAFNAFGCTDTVSQVIEVAFPETDLVLDDVIPVSSEGKINIVIRGANRGTLPINGFDILVNLDNENAFFSSPFEETLTKGEDFAHTLDFELVEGRNDIDFICVELQLREEEELNTDNNNGCFNFKQEFIIQDPFPNPVIETLRANVILPNTESRVQLTLVNSVGDILIQRDFDDLEEGLNIFDFDFRTYKAGLYLLRIRHDGNEIVTRITKE